MSWRYLMFALDIFIGFIEDIRGVSWRYLMFLLEIFDRCAGDI